MTRSLRAAALLTAVLAAACGDAPTDPAALQSADAATLELLRASVLALAESEIDEATAVGIGCDRSVAVDEVSLGRGRRLLAHAREALEEGEIELALQRAHYAGKLLDTACPSNRQEEGAVR